MSGTGSGETTFAVAANTGAARNSSITVAGTVIPVSQGGATAASDAPANVSARATGATEVTINWSPVSGASQYEISRRAPGGSFIPIGTAPSSVYVDTTPSPNTAYLYAVRVLAPAVSAWSAAD